MLPVKHILAALSYILPSIGLTLGLQEFMAFDEKLSILAGLIACLLGAEAHAAITRGIERRKTRRDLAEMKGLAAGLSRDLHNAAIRIVEIEDRFETQTNTRMDRIFSEVRMVESLVSNLLEARVGQAARPQIQPQETPQVPALQADSEIEMAQPVSVGQQTVPEDEYEAADLAAFTEDAAREAYGEMEDAAAIETAEAPEHHKAAPTTSAPCIRSVNDISEYDDGELLEVIRRALEANRVDLYLQPIVGLPQRKTRYYEGLSRLRSEDGMLIMPADYMRVAEPAGMMPTVDNILLFRCIQVVRRLASRNKQSGVFCNISAYSLLDNHFFPQFIEYMQHNTDLAQHLIFEFSQETVDNMGPIEEESLASLAELGFRFSMDQVTTLKMDIPGLHDRNFRFIKIAAPIIVGGHEGDADIHATDLSELMKRNGINLIVDKIETEREVLDVLDHNIGLGQGYLFGEPRPVREQAMKPVDIRQAETAVAA